MSYISDAEIRYYLHVSIEIENYHRERYAKAINDLDELIRKSLSSQDFEQFLKQHSSNLRDFLRGLTRVVKYESKSSLEESKPSLEESKPSLQESKSLIFWKKNNTKDEAIYFVKVFTNRVHFLRRVREDGFDLGIPKEIPLPD